MKAKQAMKILGVTRQTLCRYLKEGKVKIKAKINEKFFEYDDDSVYALIGEKSNRKNKSVVSYARVSTQNQKE